MNSPTFWGTVAALGIMGLVGSFGHCVGMCGPLVILAGSRFPTQGVSSLPYHLLYNLAKALVYTLLGFLTGWLGAMVYHAAGGGAFYGAVSLLGGLAVILSGMIYLGWIHIGQTSLVGNLWGRVARLLASVSGPSRALVLGGLNGLLPCGLVYSALLISVTAGNVLAGGLGMFVFGLGTAPSLLVIGLGAGLISLRTRKIMARIGGIFVLLVGMQLVLRGFAGFNLLPHWQIVEIMLW